MSSAYLTIRKDQKRNDGRSSICLRYKDFKNTKKDISLRIAVDYDEWDDISKQVKKSAQNYKEINKRLTFHLTRANKIIFDYEIKEKRLSGDEFVRLFTNKPVTNDLYLYVEGEMKKSAQTFSKETIRTYKSQATKLRKFRSKINLQDINSEFIREYENWMIKELKNKRNTYCKSLSWLKSIINRAIRDELLEKNPFMFYKLSKEEGTRSHLNMYEVNRLGLLLNEKGLKNNELNVLKYFLFACYTGLRYQDVKDLKYNDISDGMIRLRMHKTKNLVNIPLTAKALGLLDDKQYGLMTKVFHVISNQKTNDCLKGIIKTAGINKPISFHCARHTFATIGITLGIPIEVISKLLGHGDLRTTQIYAKIVDNVKISEMAKWDSI